MCMFVGDGEGKGVKKRLQAEGKAIIRQAKAAMIQAQ